MKKETMYNKIVNVSEDGEITILAYTFEHSDNLKGATGHTFYPVSKLEYEERTERDNVIEYLNDSGLELKESLEILDEGDFSFMFDTSYDELWPYMRKVLKLNKDEAYIFECTGGGRCFSKDYQGNKNVKLSEIIRKFES